MYDEMLFYVGKLKKPLFHTRLILLHEIVQRNFKIDGHCSLSLLFLPQHSINF